MITRTVLVALSFLCGLSPFYCCHGSLQVSGISVNVQSSSGLKARELAIADARRKAFLEIIQGNTAFKYDLKNRGMPSDDVLENAVDTFEIEKEKISSKQYIGSLSITFSDKGLKGIVENFDQIVTKDKTDSSDQTSSIKGKDVVVLPIYLTPDESLMWDTQNPWHQFWQKNQQDDGVNIHVPLGDAQDILSVSIEDIMTSQGQKVKTLLDRYEKSILVVGIVKQTSLDQNAFELTIKVFHGDRLVFSSEPLLIEGETLEEGFSKGRFEVIKALQDQRASVTRITNMSVQSYPINATFGNFSQWQQIRRALKTDSVETFKVLMLSKASAKILLKSNLTFETLVKEFARHGLVLSEGTPGTFHLSIGFAQSIPSAPRGQPVLSPLKGPKIRSAFEGSP